MIYENEKGSRVQQVKNEIVHVALVLDASSSMTHLASKLIQVADEQIKAMKTRSEELDLETRISVYTFADPYNIECVIFDKDVFRLPSIDGLYRAYGNTALIDATMLSQNDLAKTAQMYGKHHFLTFVLTDGEENRSQNRPQALRDLLATQAGNWSVAALVPNANGKQYAVQCGFPEKNVMIWDTTAAGLSKVADEVTQVTNSYMTSISRGTGYDKTNIFGTGADKVNAATISAAGLSPEPTGSYLLMQVVRDQDIKGFVTDMGHVFRLGRGFYEFTKLETIQGNKDIAIQDKTTGAVYKGGAARDLLGLTGSMRVRPDMNPRYKIHVQSTAPNRKLLAGTQLLYFV